MELATPSSRYSSQTSKKLSHLFVCNHCFLFLFLKRVFPGGSSGCMEADVVEIPPPVDWRVKPKSLHKQEEVLVPEIIDVDMDDSVDIMVIDEKVVPSCKGKGPMDITDGTKEKFLTDGHSKVPPKGFDDFGSDFFYGDDQCYDDMIFDEDYAYLQSHFDNLDIPTGIEAPIPWLLSPNSNKVPVSGGSTSSSSNNMLEASGLHASFHSSRSSLASDVKKKKSIPSSAPSGPFSSKLCQTSSKWSPSESQQMKTNVTTNAFGIPKHVGPGDSWLWQKSPKSLRSHSSSRLNKKPHPVGAYSYGLYPPKDLTLGAPHTPTNLKQQASKYNLWTELPSSTFVYQNVGIGSGNTVGTGSSGLSGVAQFPPNKAAFNPWLKEALVETKGVTSTSSSKVIYGNPDEIIEKFRLFKKFDTVQDFCDHHYYKKDLSVGQQSRGWMKKIQDEWRILEKNLPDSIYVRVCESRMDLLRAVIVGAEGTPYHDGLYFFDVSFPGSYPNSPPQVYYHSGGLRINPNLYNNGKVCLSLLGTWSGSQKENWIPGLSTTLQVLVSIQGLILNAKPYFNEPGYAHMSGSVAGEQSSLQYNERTYILSMKTMVYSVKRPPKHFEDFVAGHFYSRALDVLLACRAYIEGAQVCCIVKGGVQDVDEGGKSCSQEFRHQLAKFVKTLVDAFKLVGVKDLDQFLSLVHKADSLMPPSPHPPLPLPPGSNAPPNFNYNPFYY
ncbi:hypothetical protein Leryth_013597 [Lithospermum erythrorhizon]|nr:hypothetical protein Leryth_013597 [Lithospermum erythrorhizon]